MQRQVGIFLFDNVEVLDFAGPFEVLSITENPDGGQAPFSVRTVSERGGLIAARNNLRIETDCSMEDSGQFDLLIIPGGPGTYPIETENQPVIDWIAGQAARTEILASVCTGAFLLARAGLLNNRRATTHWRSLDRLTAEYPQVQVLKDVKYVDEGSIVTSAGISAGIDMSLHLVRRLLGAAAAETTARRMEYNWDSR